MSVRITRYCPDCAEKVRGTICAVACHFMDHDRDRRPEAPLDDLREFAHEMIRHPS